MVVRVFAPKKKKKQHTPALDIWAFSAKAKGQISYPKISVLSKLIFCLGLSSKSNSMKSIIERLCKNLVKKNDHTETGIKSASMYPCK